MTKHVLDRPKIVQNRGVRRAVDIERAQMPTRASLLLQRRHRSGTLNRRIKNFVRIERHSETVL